MTVEMEDEDEKTENEKEKTESFMNLNKVSEWLNVEVANAGVGWSQAEVECGPELVQMEVYPELEVVQLRLEDEK